jgi:hypothetical protein
MLADEEMSPKQIEILRGLSGEQRLRIADQLYWTAREMTAVGVRARHPDWSEEQVKAEVRRLFLHARS